MQKKTKKPKPTFEEEKILWKKGYNFVIGVDEVGRGAFAGPVTVGAIVFPKNPIKIANLGINDSKLLSAGKREKLSKEIKKHTLYWSTASTSVPVINKVGIGKATQMAFRKAIKKVIRSLSKKRHSGKRSASRISIGTRFWASQNDGGQISQYPNIFVLVDGFHIRYIRGIGLKNQKAIVKGDRKSISIAAASIIAKVHRDSLMKKLHKKYHIYNFAKNKGYGTKLHQQAIKQHGLSNIHRKSFNLAKFMG